MDLFSPRNHSISSSVEAGLELIEKLSTEDFVHYMLGIDYDRELIERCLSGADQGLLENLKQEQRLLLQQPEKTKRQFMQFLFSYLPYFSKEQRRFEPWIIRSVHEIQEKLSEDPYLFVSNIHPRFHVKDTYVEFHKAKNYRFSYGDLQKIYVVPSTFVYPHLLLGIFDESISVGYPVETPGNTEKFTVPNDLIKVMKALSDPTRAAILKSLLHHPYCIQQLSDLHGISEPAVLKHIKLLKETGLVWSERRGYYIFYHGDQSRLEMLTVELHQFIDMPHHKNSKE